MTLRTEAALYELGKADFKNGLTKPSGAYLLSSEQQVWKRGWNVARVEAEIQRADGAEKLLLRAEQLGSEPGTLAGHALIFGIGLALILAAVVFIILCVIMHGVPLLLAFLAVASYGIGYLFLKALAALKRD